MQANTRKTRRALTYRVERVKSGPRAGQLVWRRPGQVGGGVRWIGGQDAQMFEVGSVMTLVPGSGGGSRVAR